MNDYKLIASDLDGTLLDSSTNLSEENRRAIKELTDMGVVIVPTTGRVISEMRQVYDLPEIRYVIYSTGAAIYDKQTQETTLFGLDAELTNFIFDALDKYDALTIVHRDGNAYVERSKALRACDYSLHKHVQSIVENFCIQIENLRETFADGNIEGFASFFADERERDEYRNIISSNSELYCTVAWERNLEVFHKSAGKGRAIRHLADKLGVEMKNVISIGDSGNDVDMTLMSGLGLATANATDVLKKVADKVICTNDEHIMRYVKEHIICANV